MAVVSWTRLPTARSARCISVHTAHRTRLKEDEISRNAKWLRDEKGDFESFSQEQAPGECITVGAKVQFFKDVAEVDWSTCPGDCLHFLQGRA